MTICVQHILCLLLASDHVWVQKRCVPPGVLAKSYHYPVQRIPGYVNVYSTCMNTVCII